MKTNIDLFDNYNKLPLKIKDIIHNFNTKSNTYETCKELVSELEIHGYTCEYGLDAEPHSLRKLETTNETPEEMNITENNKFLELETILSFLGIIFIDYKGNRTSNGHISAKTIGEIKDFFGKEVMASGQFIKDINHWDFQNNWNDLIFLTEKIEEIEGNRFKVEIYNNVCRIYDHQEYEDITEITAETKIKATKNACVEFILWYNQQKN